MLKAQLREQGKKMSEARIYKELEQQPQTQAHKKAGDRKGSVADPGCLSRIPDPTFFHPGSRIRPVSIPDPGSA
jgi:hypothetical protein